MGTITDTESRIVGFEGAVLRPGSEEYERARRVFNGMFDRKPALVARCHSEGDVVAALRHARTHGLPIAVRGGGHSAPGYGTCDDGLVIDLSGMREVHVDPAARTARVAGGATWMDLDVATQAHGLAVTGGRVSSTGVAGLTLGGGSGWLERWMGLTSDNLLAIRMVTADGLVVRASRTENTELFWGLRGAGANFGVVIEFTFELRPIGPAVLGGLVGYAMEDAAQAARFYRDFIANAPDEVCGALVFVTLPPAPEVPPPLRGQRVLAVQVLYAGSIEDGEKAFQPLRAFGKPLFDTVGPTTYLAVQQASDAGNPQGRCCYFKAEFMKDLPDQAIDTAVEYAGRMPSPHTVVFLEPMGGAFARVPEHESPIGARDAGWCYHALSNWDGLETSDVNIAWARELADALAPHASPGVYLTYLSEVGEKRIRSTFGAEKYARLLALKNAWDPHNVFALNQNIQPHHTAANT